MTRAEIGSYLGLKLETVSRVLSRFSHDNLIIVNQKHVQILDFDGLRAIVSGQTFFDNHSAQVKNDMKRGRLRVVFRVLRSARFRA